MKRFSQYVPADAQFFGQFTLRGELSSQSYFLSVYHSIKCAYNFFVQQCPVNTI